MLITIRPIALAAALVLLAVPTARCQDKEKPAPKEQVGLDAVGRHRSSTSRIRTARRLTGPIPQQGQGRPGVLSLGRLVTVLP